jgi:uncharacterized protein YbjT (DUF2867 family)
MNRAIVLGATGLVGSHLLNLLLKDEQFDTVKVFTRRFTGIHHPKLEEYLVNFDHVEEWQHLVKGNVLFSTLGTTLKQAGSKEVQYKVDYTYQWKIAEAAARNGVGTYVLVSAANASLNSVFFYSRLKAKLERDVARLPFLNIHILRPGPLEGKREATRFWEGLFIKIMGAVRKTGMFKGMKPIPARTVAKTMVNACFSTRGRTQIYPPNTIAQLARKEV